MGVGSGWPLPPALGVQGSQAALNSPQGYFLGYQGLPGLVQTQCLGEGG